MLQLPVELQRRIAEMIDKRRDVLSLSLVSRRLVDVARDRAVRTVVWPASAAQELNMLRFFQRRRARLTCVRNLLILADAHSGGTETMVELMLAAPKVKQLRLKGPGATIRGFGEALDAAPEQHRAGLRLLQIDAIPLPPRTSWHEMERAYEVRLWTLAVIVRRAGRTLRSIKVDSDDWCLQMSDDWLSRTLADLPKLPKLRQLVLHGCQLEVMQGLLEAAEGSKLSLTTQEDDEVLRALAPTAAAKVRILDHITPPWAFEWDPVSPATLAAFTRLQHLAIWGHCESFDLRTLPPHLISITAFISASQLQFSSLLEQARDPDVAPDLCYITLHLEHPHWLDEDDEDRALTVAEEETRVGELVEAFAERDIEADILAAKREPSPTDSDG